MKKLVVIATALISLTGFAAADIQAPPSSQYTSSRKLGRALSNILYGLTEIPEQMVRKGQEQGRSAGWSYGIVDGTNRAMRRLGYGFYELFTFTCPTYRGTYKQPYERCGEDNRIQMNVADGLSEYPPELGFESYFSHTRTQQY
jgi:putative exosortase-associated protein (TIGR04073 family)